MVRAMVCVLVLCFWGAILKAETAIGGSSTSNKDLNMQTLPNETIPVSTEDLSSKAVLERVERFYRATESFYLEFTQEVYWRRGYEVEVSGGKIWFRKPNRLRWEYTYPELLLIVSDGQKVYFYSAEDRQVTVFPLEKAFSKLILGFLSGRIHLIEKFYLTFSERLENGFYILELKPQEEETQISRVRLKVFSETGEIKEMWYWDLLGNLTHLVFENARFNLKIEDQKFLFVPPEGVEFIEEAR